MVGALEALERLRAGNQRFVAEQGSHARVGEERRSELTSGQAPFAVILGCADSRVPAEIVFDQGFGDLFVIRVAGNIAGPSQIGSAEFAAEQLGSRLVVVLGHSGCGAVSATLDSLGGDPSGLSPGLRAIVDRIRPSVEPLVRSEAGGDPASLMDRAVQANVRTAVETLRRQSAVLEELIRDDGLLVIGAEYSLETGRVEFFGAPESQVDST